MQICAGNVRSLLQLPLWRVFCFVWFICEKNYSHGQDLPLPQSFINPAVETAQTLWDGITKREIREFHDIKKPSYILSTSGHSLYISSFMTDEVLFVDDMRSKSSSLSTFARGNGLDGPWGIVEDGTYLYVASFTTDQIHKYEKKTRRFVKAFGNEAELDCPEGMTLGPNRTLYVASFINDRIVKYTTDGKFLGVVADSSSGIKGPEDVALLKSGILLVTSHYSDNILKYNSSTGKSLGIFAKVDRPVGLTVGVDGHVYATSYVTNTVLRFNGVTGAFLDVFASGHNLRGPSSISFADGRTLYCASYDNDKILLFNTTSGVSLTLPANSRFKGTLL